MSIRWMSDIWEFGPKDPTRRLVLLALADNADDTGRCFPALDVITKKCCLGERMVRYHLRALEGDGFIETNHDGQGRGRRNIYKLLKPWLERGQPIAALEEEKGGNPLLPLEEKGGNGLHKRGQPIAGPLINHHEPSVKDLTITHASELQNLTDLVLLASPEFRLRSRTITPADRVHVIQAAKREAKNHGLSQGDAMETLRRTVESQVMAWPSDQLRYLGETKSYFGKENYRKRPEDFTGGNGNGKHRAIDERAKLVLERMRVAAGTRPGLHPAVGIPRREHPRGLCALLGKP